LLQKLSGVDIDVVVVDQRMPNKTGLEVLSELRAEGSGLVAVLLAGTLSDEEVLKAFQLGVQGVILKEDASATVVDCIRRVHEGERWWPQELMERALDTALREQVNRRTLSEDLTPREVEIVRRVAEGCSNKRIARLLSVSEGTVKTHLHSIFKKVGVGNRVQLTLFAQEEGLVELKT